jgi:hypothetical protein
MMRGLLAGAVAGAVGTMALDVVSYVDMALRGRQSSDMPAEVIRLLAEKAGCAQLGVPTDEASTDTKNRRSALGALSGYAIGIGIGALYGAISLAAGTKRRLLLRTIALGALAMAASDVPATLLGATNPKDWNATSWASDIMPHMAYGLATAAVVSALDHDD